MKAEVEIAGAVEKLQFVSPHGSLSIAAAAPDGSTKTWVFTMGSATSLAQRGIGKTGPNALKVGDKVTVKFLPAKNGAPIGFLRSVTFPDGHTIVVSTGPND
jgi:hypothetical protein